MRPADPRHSSGISERFGAEEPSYVEKALGLSLLLLLGVGSVFVIYPFFNAILLAVPLSVSTYPLFRRLQSWLSGRRTLASVCMTLSMAGILVVPLVALGVNLADDLNRLNAAYLSAVERGLPPPNWLVKLPAVGVEAERVWLQVSQHGAELRPTLAPYLGPIRSWALQQAASLLGGILQVVLSVCLLFFLYRDGAYAEARLEEAMARLGGWRARHVLRAGGATIRSVVNGVVGTALVQGILLGGSFWAAGIPGEIVFGALAVVLAFMPLGLALLWLPASLWLMSQGQTNWALFILIWNALFVGTLDNVLRPYLIGRGARLPAVLVLLGVLGGVISFGIVGVFVGPVMLAVAYTLFQDWGADFEPDAAEHPLSQAQAAFL